MERMEDVGLLDEANVLAGKNFCIYIIRRHALTVYGIYICNQTLGNLSGGQKRKLCVAIALVGDCKCVFLDEPTANLDPFSRTKVHQLIAREKKDRVIILTTHYMDEADLLSDRIGILQRGNCFYVLIYI